MLGVFMLVAITSVALYEFGDYLIFLIGILGGGVQLGPLGTAATNGLLCQPRVIMMMEYLME
jgi:hypothetical protein